MKISDLMFSCYSCFTLSNIYKLLLVSFSENLVVVNSTGIFSKKRMITPQDSPFLVPWKVWKAFGHRLQLLWLENHFCCPYIQENFSETADWT